MPSLARRFTLCAALAAALLAPVAVPQAAPAADAKAEAALFARDGAFKWEVVSTQPVPGGTMRTVRLTSQSWQGITWKHWLRVIEPDDAKHGDTAILVVSGGRNREQPPEQLSREAMMLPMIAAQTGSVVALLEQTPNQPLFDGLNEDRLIAYTFKKFLETSDPSWPALVPMVRSAMRAMDAVQEMTAGREGKATVEKFFVTGASKRGWTTWLTAAHDARVVGISPMVIDVVHMAKQMPHQVESFGTYSNQIDPYTALGLPQKVDGPEAAKLLDIVDPWEKREALTLPKLLVLGTNDPYWTSDAVNLYYGGLKGETYVSYVPNAGHGLGPQAYLTATAYYRRVLEGKPRPQFSWTRKLDAAAGTASIALAAKDAPDQVELFTATAPTRDFRKAVWKSAPLERQKDGGWLASVPLSRTDCTASYLALTYKDEGGASMTLCTTIEVVGADGVSGPTAATGMDWEGFKPAAPEKPAAKPKRVEF